MKLTSYFPCLRSALLAAALVASTSAMAAGPAVQTLDAAAVEKTASGALGQWLAERTTHSQTLASAVSSSLPVPAGAVSLRARPLARDQRITPHMQVLVDVAANGRFARTVAVHFNVQAMVQAWVALRDLEAGAELQAAELSQHEVDVAMVNGVVHGGPVAGLRLAWPLHAGQVLLAHQARPRPAVQRGEAVELRSVDAGIELRAQAVALHDAAVGNPVRVRLASAGKLLNARVISAGVVEYRP